MGFWVFMLAMVLLTPAIMIGAGRMMLRHCPEEINSVIGYRTRRSMKNEETWRFAHEHCGKLWWKAGWWSLIPSALALLPFLNAGRDKIGTVGAALMTAQVIVLIAAIFPTEMALKRTFDENGNRKI